VTATTNEEALCARCESFATHCVEDLTRARDRYREECKYLREEVQLHRKRAEDAYRQTLSLEDEIRTMKALTEHDSCCGD